MYEVKVKQLDSINVISKKAPIPNYEVSGEINMALFRAAREHILSNGHGLVGYDIALYYGIPGQSELVIEAAIPVSGDFPAVDGITQVELPKVDKMAYVIHYGGYTTIHLAHATIQQWMAENGYVPAGPVRDVYLAFDPTGDPNKFVTELQYPVQKIQ